MASNTPTRNYIWPHVVLSPTRDEDVAHHDRSILHLNDSLPAESLGVVEEQWSLSDLTIEGEKKAVEADNTVRNGAKVAVADLYHQRKISESATAVKDNIAEVTEALASTSLEGQDCAAHHAVLRTTELLEIILGFLPRPALWRQTYVCQTWRDLILTSPTLKRHVGFTSMSRPQMPVHERISTAQIYKINPVLNSLNLIHKDDNVNGVWPLRTTVNFPARWRTVNAHWRDLQICEPPLQRVFLQSAWLDKYIECETGVTAGILADRLELSRTGIVKLSHSS